MKRVAVEKPTERDSEDENGILNRMYDFSENLRERLDIKRDNPLLVIIYMLSILSVSFLPALTIIKMFYSVSVPSFLWVLGVGLLVVGACVAFVIGLFWCYGHALKRDVTMISFIHFLCLIVGIGIASGIVYSALVQSPSGVLEDAGYQVHEQVEEGKYLCPVKDTKGTTAHYVSKDSHTYIAVIGQADDGGKKIVRTCEIGTVEDN